MGAATPLQAIPEIRPVARSAHENALAILLAPLATALPLVDRPAGPAPALSGLSWLGAAPATVPLLGRASDGVTPATRPDPLHMLG